MNEEILIELGAVSEETKGVAGQRPEATELQKQI